VHSTERARSQFLKKGNQLFKEKCALQRKSWLHPRAPAGFFPGVGKLGDPEMKVPEWGPGMEFWWGLEASPQKPTTHCQNNAKIIGLLSVLL